MGYRGEGYVELEDGWLSIPGALPGERVVVEVPVADSRSRRVFGTLIEIIEPSPRRADPHCDRVSVCRGCQLRHVAMVDELAIKTETVVECVEKYGGVPREEQPPVETIAVPGATRADAFRVRTTLTVRRTASGWETGLRAPGDRIVPMAGCPALADTVERAVVRVDRALAAFDPSPDHPQIRNIRVASPVHGHGYVDVLVERVEESFEPLLAALDRQLPSGFGIALSDGSSRRHYRGPRRFRLPMADLRLEVGFEDWFHATLEPAEELYAAVPAWIELQEGQRVLDAGCGIGTIGLLCARAGADVVGFDINPASVENAELNAMNNELSVEFRTAGWERAFRDLVLEGRQFDTVVINPMRDPLGARPLAYLEKLRAERVLYLGPSAAPAAKDLGSLREMGWTLQRLGAANLHPATYHVMLVALCGRA